MKRILSLCIICCIFFVGCEPLQQEEASLPGKLEKITLGDLSAIPLSFGELEAVTAHSQYEGWAQLWFVDEQQTVRMVRVEFHTNRIHENVLVIPRN